MSHSRTLSLSLALGLATACGGSGSSHGNGSNEPVSGNEHPASTADAASESSDAASADAAPAALPPLALVVGTSTALEPGDDPHVAIRSPANNAVLRTNSAEIQLHVTGWGAPTGMRHIHLILDNDPYVRIDNPAVAHTFTNLAPGMHVVRAFPGRMSHESVKRAGAFAMVVFYVGPRPRTPGFDPHAPLLTYSRPKGNYAGEDAKKVMVDFWLTNATLGKSGGPMVKLVVDDQAPQLLQAWKPTYLEGLADGEHKISLDLVDAKGKPVENAFNHTERTFTINAAPAAPAPAPVAPAPAPEKK